MVRPPEAPALLTQHRAVLRRGLVLLIAFSVLLIVAFYALTDGAYLSHDHALDGADWLGYAVCHRISGRSFAVAGRQMPLCARCTGMYLGVALVLLVMALAGRLRRSYLPPPRTLVILLSFIALMGIDGLNSYAHFFPQAPTLYEPRNWLRLLTGTGTGLAMGLLLLPALAQTLWKRPDARPIITGGRELGGLILAAGGVILLVLSNHPALLYVLAVVSSLSLVLVVAALNTIFLLVLLRREGRAATWVQGSVPLVAGLISAVVLLSVVSMARFALTGTMTGFPGL